METYLLIIVLSVKQSILGGILKTESSCLAEAKKYQEAYCLPGLTGIYN